MGWNFGVQPIPRVAPRVAPRIGFSHKLGRECHSENCSENTPEFRELLREWPFHSESVFFKIGVVPRFLRNGLRELTALARTLAIGDWRLCPPKIKSGGGFQRMQRMLLKHPGEIIHSSSGRAGLEMAAFEVAPRSANWRNPRHGWMFLLLNGSRVLTNSPNPSSFLIYLSRPKSSDLTLRFCLGSLFFFVPFFGPMLLSFRISFPANRNRRKTDRAFLALLSPSTLRGLHPELPKKKLREASKLIRPD